MTNDAPSNPEAGRRGPGVLSILFSFRGRITRAEMWLAALTWFFVIGDGAMAVSGRACRQPDVQKAP